MVGTTLRTDRLLLRPWRPADLQPFAAMNLDPRVMAHLPASLTRVESAALMDRILADFEREGWGLFALELPGAMPFAGFVGLDRPRFVAPFTSCVEIGWRLAFAAQGRGYATEAAREVVRVAFEAIGLSELVSFTVPRNLASRGVMEKLGMRQDGEFEHPSLPEGHALRRHLLYRLSAPGSWNRHPEKGRNPS